MAGLDPATQSRRVCGAKKVIDALTRVHWVGGSGAAHGEVGFVALRGYGATTMTSNVPGIACARPPPAGGSPNFADII